MLFIFLFHPDMSFRLVRFQHDLDVIVAIPMIAKQMPKSQLRHVKTFAIETGQERDPTDELLPSLCFVPCLARFEGCGALEELNMKKKVLRTCCPFLPRPVPFFSFEPFMTCWTS